jgi:hypothetical protein
MPGGYRHESAKREGLVSTLKNNFQSWKVCNRLFRLPLESGVDLLLLYQ